MMRRPSVVLLTMLVALSACGPAKRAGYLSKTAPPPRGTTTPPAPHAPSAATHAPAPLDLPAPRPELPPTADRSMPLLEPARSVPRPSYETVTLKNGIRALVAPMPGAPRVAVEVISGRGFWDAGDKDLLTADVLDEALKIAPVPSTVRPLSEDAKALGASASVWITNDKSATWILCPAPLLAECSIALFDHTFRPSLTDEVVREAKTRASEEIARGKDGPSLLASRAAYGEKHPKALPGWARAGELQNVDAAAVRALHERLFDRRSIVLAAAGGATKEQIVATLNATVGALPMSKEGPLAKRPIPAAAPMGNVVVRDARGSSELQAYVMAKAPLSTAPARAALEIAARHLEITSKEMTWIYGERDHDLLTIYVKGPRAAKGKQLRELVAEIDRLRTRNLTDAELARAKARARLGLGKLLGLPNSVAAYASYAWARGEPIATLADVRDAIDRVTAEDVRRLAATHLAAGSLRVFALGDFVQARNDLVALGLGEPVLYAENQATAVASAAQPSAPGAPPPPPPPPGWASSPPPPPPPPPPSYDDSALREAERAEREAREAREEREARRRAEEAEEDRRIREEAARERAEADRRFQEQLRQMQEDFQRQLQNQRNQTADVIARAQEAQRRRQEELERQREEAKRRADERERERERQRAERERREREQRELEERRERERREAAKRAADEARRKNEELKRRLEEDRRKNEEALKRIAEENRKIAERARGGSKPGGTTGGGGDSRAPQRKVTIRAEVEGHADNGTRCCEDAQRQFETFHAGKCYAQVKGSYVEGSLRDVSECRVRRQSAGWKYACTISFVEDCYAPD